MTIPIGGHIEPGFAPVGTAFGRLFSTGAETGAALVVTHRGRLVGERVRRLVRCRPAAALGAENVIHGL
jgi:hypothetical protein